LHSHETEPLLGTSHFRVLIGERDVGFCDVGPLTSETVPPYERKHTFATVMLRRALTTSSELFDWRRRIVGGAEDSRDVVVQQLESARGPVVNSWRLVRAWPCRWSGPSFDAREAGIAYEEVELAFDDLVWEPHREGA
jgi:phage tail-like protein